MRKLIPILCVILLTACGGEDECHFETPEDPKFFKVPYKEFDKDTLEKALRKFKGGNEC